MLSRRQFMQGTAATAAALTLGHLVTKSPSVAWKWTTEFHDFNRHLQTTLTVWVDGVKHNMSVGNPIWMYDPLMVPQYNRIREHHQQLLRHWAQEQFGVRDYLL